eukprot:gene19696-biopygen13959
MATNQGDFDYGSVDTSEWIVEPYQFEPMPRENEVAGSSEPNRSDFDSSEEDEPDINIDRIGNTNWQC